MKIKAVIAHRYELPANLHRTYYHIRSHGVEVELIEDAEGLGCGYARHKAIMQTDADAVLICDAHMKFSSGYFQSVVDHLSKHPNDITVSQMQSLDYEWDELPGELYAGAYIKLMDAWSGNFNPIGAKWRRQKSNSNIICAVMGACYGMTVQNYKRIGQPLSVLRAWGGDEEILSIANWMTGGRVCLIPGTAYHIYAAPRINAKNMTDRELAAFYGNRLAIINAIPMPSNLSKKLIGHLYRNTFPLNNMHLINETMQSRQDDIDRLFHAINKNKKMEFVDYVQRFTEPENSIAEGEYMAKRAKADKERKVKRQYTQAPRVIDEGVPCPHCGVRYDHKVTNTYKHGKKRRLCGNCNKPFITCRK